MGKKRNEEQTQTGCESGARGFLRKQRSCRRRVARGACGKGGFERDNNEVGSNSVSVEQRARQPRGRRELRCLMYFLSIQNPPYARICLYLCVLVYVLVHVYMHRKKLATMIWTCTLPVPCMHVGVFMTWCMQIDETNRGGHIRAPPRYDLNRQPMRRARLQTCGMTGRRKQGYNRPFALLFELSKQNGK
jgi:hypothetical protein